VTGVLRMLGVAAVTGVLRMLWIVLLRFWFAFVSNVGS
jgi:hypothetical protein